MSAVLVFLRTNLTNQVFYNIGYSRGGCSQAASSVGVHNDLGDQEGEDSEGRAKD